MIKRRIVGGIIAAAALVSSGIFVGRAIAAGVPGTDVQCTRIDYPTTTAELTFGHLADTSVHITRYMMACVQVDGLPSFPGAVPCPDDQNTVKVMGGGSGDGCPGTIPAPDPIPCYLQVAGQPPVMATPTPNASNLRSPAPVAATTTSGGCPSEPVACASEPGSQSAATVRTFGGGCGAQPSDCGTYTIKAYGGAGVLPPTCAPRQG